MPHLVVGGHIYRFVMLAYWGRYMTVVKKIKSKVSNYRIWSVCETEKSGCSIPDQVYTYREIV